VSVLFIHTAFYLFFFFELAENKGGGRGRRGGRGNQYFLSLFFQSEAEITSYKYPFAFLPYSIFHFISKESAGEMTGELEFCLTGLAKNGLAS
jgi:hypothetical protein